MLVRREASCRMPHSGIKLRRMTMKTRICILALVAALSLMAGCSKSTTAPETLTIEDLLVKNNELAGWTYGDERWVARNEIELFGAINGAGDVNVRYGFREGAGQSYSGIISDTPATLKLYVFDQTTGENAESVFNDPDSGMSTAVPWPGGAGDEAHHLTAELANTLTFYRGKYYVWLNINFGQDEGLNVLKQFALNVDGKIE
jgi:hypothetical protein